MALRSCLIVDDSPTSRRLVAAAVRAARKGVTEFHEADDPEAALRILSQNSPDVVFLDMMLAGDDVHVPDGAPARGVGLLRQILAKRPELPVVVVTGLAPGQPDVVDAISQGAIAALRKPVRADEVRFVLESLEPDRHAMDYFG